MPLLPIPQGNSSGQLGPGRPARSKSPPSRWGRRATVFLNGRPIRPARRPFFPPVPCSPREVPFFPCFVALSNTWPGPMRLQMNLKTTGDVEEHGRNHRSIRFQVIFLRGRSCQDVARRRERDFPSEVGSHGFQPEDGSSDPRQGWWPPLGSSGGLVQIRGAGYGRSGEWKAGDLLRRSRPTPSSNPEQKSILDSVVAKIMQHPKSYNMQ